jgi:hypothetical protein
LSPKQKRRGRVITHATRNIVKRFGAIADWHSAIAESRIDGDVPDGTPGCARVLRLADGGKLRERLLAFDDTNRSLT